jgi:hypothetical protein
MKWTPKAWRYASLTLVSAVGLGLGIYHSSTLLGFCVLPLGLGLGGLAKELGYIRWP